MIVCSDIPNSFYHLKQHIIKLPYIKEFNESKIPTKARPIQMSQEVLEFCKTEIQELLLSKGIISIKVSLHVHALHFMFGRMPS